MARNLLLSVDVRVRDLPVVLGLGLVFLAGAAGCHGRIVGDATAADDDPAVRPDAAPVVPPGAPDARPAEEPPRDPPASAIGCDAAGLFFCDDFESYAVGEARSARWKADSQAGSLAIDDAQARGRRALHVHTDGNGRAMIRVDGFAPTGNSFFARMYVFADAFPTAPAFAHFTMMEASGSGAGLVRPVGGQFVPAPTAGRSLWGVGSDGGPTGDWTSWQPTAPAESGRWLCLEVELRSADNAVDVWIDGVARPELSVSTRVHGGAPVDFVFPRFDQLWFGWQLYQGNPTPAGFDLWLDDLAIGPSRLGC